MNTQKTIVFDLGRQPKLGFAELSRVFSEKADETVSLIAPSVASVVLPSEAPAPNISFFGGSKKSGVVISAIPSPDFRNLGDFFSPSFSFIKNNLPLGTGRISLGISLLGQIPSGITPNEIIKLQSKIKNALKKQNIATRFIMPTSLELSTAVSHHNKLGLSQNKIELFIIFTNQNVLLAFSTGAQNISAYAARDQNRPFRSAKNGMLPPKLAQILINLAAGQQNPGGKTRKPTVLDPFCGSGTILQEALLMGFAAYGTDKNPKMPAESQSNIDWLRGKYHYLPDCRTEIADATNHKWAKPFDVIATEIYLGPPMSQIPAPAKLKSAKKECEDILRGFLSNLAPQIKSGFPLCIAIPAWATKQNGFSRLTPLDISLEKEYNRLSISGASDKDLIYHREGQIVGRELLILSKK